MKRKTGILLLAVLNAGFIYFAWYTVSLRFGMIVITLKKEVIPVITRETTQVIVTDPLLFFLPLAVINFILFRKMILAKRSFLYTGILSLVLILFSAGILLSERHSFINRQQEESSRYIKGS